MSRSSEWPLLFSYCPLKPWMHSFPPHVYHIKLRITQLILLSVRLPTLNWHWHLPQHQHLNLEHPQLSVSTVNLCESWPLRQGGRAATWPMRGSFMTHGREGRSERHQRLQYGLSSFWDCRFRFLDRFSVVSTWNGSNLQHPHAAVFWYAALPTFPNKW